MTPNDMTFWQHVGELRKLLFWYVSSFLVILLFVHTNVEKIVSWLLDPLGTDHKSLQFLSPLDPLLFILKVDFVVSFFISLPILTILIWRFLSPALVQSRNKFIGLIIFFSTLLTYIAVGYAYFAVIPIVINFMNTLVFAGTEVAFTAQGYLGFTITTFLLLILISQIPLAIVLGTSLKLFNIKAITGHRRELYLVIFVVAAIITPTTDVFTLALVCIPAILMTETGILIARHI